MTIWFQKNITFLKPALTFNMIGYVKSGKGMKDYVSVAIAKKTRKFRKWLRFFIINQDCGKLELRTRWSQTISI